MSSQPRPELRPYVRAYAQRVVEKDDPILVQSVPAELEQILDLEFGVMPGIRYRGLYDVSHVAWFGGAQSSFSGYLELRPGVESFAVFFQPAGWSLLFKVPVAEVTNRIMDATSIPGSTFRSLWNRMGEASTFEARVQIVEQFLLERVVHASIDNKMTSAANYIFRCHGTIKISSLASRYSLGVRQFERAFERETGISPKIFARIARFQAALDADNLAATHLARRRPQLRLLRPDAHDPRLRKARPRSPKRTHRPDGRRPPSRPRLRRK